MRSSSFCFRNAGCLRDSLDILAYCVLVFFAQVLPDDQAKEFFGVRDATRCSS